MNVMPPTISYFQDINRMISKISAGILCINSASTVGQNLEVFSKTSKENIAKKRIKIIANIRGVQKINLFVFFCIIINNPTHIFFGFFYISHTLADRIINRKDFIRCGTDFKKLMLFSMFGYFDILLQ